MNDEIQGYNPPDYWIEGREDAIEAIREERRQQLLKWGIRSDMDHGTMLKILVEEVGEVAQAMLDVQNAKDADEAGDAVRHLEEELVQVGAFAAAAKQMLATGKA